MPGHPVDIRADHPLDQAIEVDRGLPSEFFAGFDALPRRLDLCRPEKRWIVSDVVLPMEAHAGERTFCEVRTTMPRLWHP